MIFYIHSLPVVLSSALGLDYRKPDIVRQSSYCPRSSLYTGCISVQTEEPSDSH